jgi:hypothetical protein
MDYVRQSQARLPERVGGLRALPPQHQRYAGGNLPSLLARLRGELRDVDLSGLALWQPFLAGLLMRAPLATSGSNSTLRRLWARRTGYMKRSSLWTAHLTKQIRPPLLLPLLG